ncbi:MAG: flagellar biosynthetic protein FliQ [Betaproteobacteria bacterium TMED82]|nr:MAG: flagellar biosynthetic protein FliQ [Betaproteobacteria bacterium TMED82]|tara:strand:- start:53646 stop:53915 length:270 start_codon:yes stop_codon:yes gene_type:complete
MDVAAVMDIGREALLMVILISSPMLGLGLLVGLIIGILQAATSVNEMTLTFVPKLVAVGIGIAFFGPWMINTLIDFATSMFQKIPTLFF